MLDSEVAHHRVVLGESDMDVSSGITVIDIDDVEPRKPQRFIFVTLTIIKIAIGNEIGEELSHTVLSNLVYVDNKKICVPPYIMGIVISVMIILVILTVATTVLHCNLKRFASVGISKS